MPHESRHDRPHKSKSHRSRSRSRSPRRSHREASTRDRKDPRTTVLPPVLPLKARQLDKHDFKAYTPLLALYLEVQKQVYVEDHSERELKGRFKSFVGKWNRGELAEGWYDPATKAKADANAVEPQYEDERIEQQHSSERAANDASRPVPRRDGMSSEDEEIGPSLPSSGAHGRSGPLIPRREDLEMRNEQRQSDRANDIADLRYERKQDRATQKSRLEDLAPRPDSGTHAARVEKKRDAAYVKSSYQAAQEGGMQEVGDSEAMGDDGIDAYKRQKKEQDRKKNEREVRKEEVLRARAAEREERLSVLRQKEDKTMEMLKNIAKERFG